MNPSPALPSGAVAPACWLCDTTHGIRKLHDGWGPCPPEYVCEDCFTGTDTGPSFDDLPEVTP